LRLGEHLPALSSDELAEYFIPLAGIIQPNPAPVEIDIEPITILEQEPPAAPLQSSPIEIDEQSPAALPAIGEQPPLDRPTAVEERAPALQRDITASLVTSEDKLVGLVIKHRIPAADVQLRPAHFRDHDLQYAWKRWERLGSEVDQFNEDAIRARTRHAWSVFTIWLIDVAAATNLDDPINPIREIATLAEQIRGGRTEEPPPLAATDVVAILPLVPPAAPLEIEAPPESPAPAAPPSPSPAPAEIDARAQASLPLDRADPADIAARNLQAALDLAGAGLPIFPARVSWENGRWKKQPITKGWQVERADQGRVRASWRQYPKAVPGIALGRAGLVVIDVDRHGGPDGVATFDKLVAEYGGLPPGPVVRTASGGFHYYF
jgi:hypothetical protein